MKKRTKFISAFIFICFSACILSSSFAADSTYCVSKTVPAGKDLSFSEADILSQISDPNKIDGIILCELPDPNVGVLKFGTRELLPGEAITREGIKALKFVPVSSVKARTAFSCIPVYRSGKTHSAVSMNISVLTKENLPPAVKPIDITTAKNIAISGFFNGSDPENDMLTYSVIRQPQSGRVEVCTDSPNKFLYTPHQNKSGNDSFEYIATDSQGNSSAPATVSVHIERSILKLSYADLDNSGVEYQAAKLSERGIFTGESIGNKHFLYPEKPVTRSEFITMVMVLCEQTHAVPPVTATGFADDDSTPVWAKAAIAAAASNGIIQGITTDSGQYFRPNDIIIRSEAAVILNNLLPYENIETARLFTDAKIIPTWAQQASSSVTQMAVMPAYHDNTMRPYQKLTRLDAVELIYHAMCAISK